MMRMMQSRWRAVVVLALLGLGLGIPGATAPGDLRSAALEERFNFGVVIEGAVYRSRAPSPEFLAYMGERYGVRTIVDLRNPASFFEGPRIRREEGWATTLGLRHVLHPILDPADADTVLGVVDSLLSSAQGPVLIHCEGGKDRTGTLVALMRLRQGRSFEATLAEMERHRHRPGKQPEIQQFLRSRFDRRAAP
jgi:protein tyrosine/serine phosphatase